MEEPSHVLIQGLPPARRKGGRPIYGRGTLASDFTPVVCQRSRVGPNSSALVDLGNQICS